MEINLFDQTGAHLFHQDALDIRAAMSGRVSNALTFKRYREEYDGITVFSESYMASDMVLKVKSKYKVGWMIENHKLGGASSSVYQIFDSIVDRFDFVMTWEDDLLKRYPTKTRYLNFADTFIWEPAIYDKSLHCSTIVSTKRVTEGHVLRHDLINLRLPNVHIYGGGVHEHAKDLHIVHHMGEPQEMPNWTNQPADQYRNFGLTNRKDYGLRDYRFSVTIENLRDVNYFTEKLIDCFLTGTVPIYWGCPNIESFFDTRGMVIVDNLTDIVNAVNNLTTEDYDRMLPFIRKNYETAQNYNFVWDRVAEVLKELK